ncbi:MAG: TRAP-type transport system, periplasmic component, predicted N-acetylneuraminate-binding protein, partial [uncultured Ramlibacter sp.]
ETEQIVGGHGRRAGDERRGARPDHHEDQHLDGAELPPGRGHRHLRARGGEAHRGPLQGPDLLQRLARRRARVHRGGAAGHAGTDDDVDRPGAQLRARDQGAGRALPVPRQGPCPRSARRPDRPGPADQVRCQGLQGAGLGRERLPPHDQLQARREGAGGPQGAEDAHHGEPGAHRGLQELRHHHDADGLPRGVHGPAAGHGGRPGEPAVGDHRRQVRPGAEAPHPDRPRLLALPVPDEQGGVRQAERRRQAALPRCRQGGHQGQPGPRRRGRCQGRGRPARQGHDRDRQRRQGQVRAGAGSGQRGVREAVRQGHARQDPELQV